MCLLPPKVGLEFYHAARNALALYEAIIPVKVSAEGTINYSAIILYVDKFHAPFQEFW